METHERNSAVGAPGNLRLIGVDKDPGVTERATSTVARYNAVLGPADGLLVDKINSSIGPGLSN